MNIKGENVRRLFGLMSIPRGHLPLQIDANCPTGSGFGNRVRSTVSNGTIGVTPQFRKLLKRILERGSTMSRLSFRCFLLVVVVVRVARISQEGIAIGLERSAAITAQRLFTSVEITFNRSCRGRRTLERFFEASKSLSIDPNSADLLSVTRRRSRCSMAIERDF